MSAVVLDASVFGPLLIPDEADHEHPSLVPILEEGAGLVPAHWHLEVANLGRSAVRRDRLTEAAFLDRLADFGEFEIQIDAETPRRAWQETVRLAIRHGLTPYDAAYLELAIRHNAILLCDDRLLADAARAEKVEML